MPRRRSAMLCRAFAAGRLGGGEPALPVHECFRTVTTTPHARNHGNRRNEWVEGSIGAKTSMGERRSRKNERARLVGLHPCRAASANARGCRERKCRCVSRRRKRTEAPSPCVERGLSPEGTWGTAQHPAGAGGRTAGALQRRGGRSVELLAGDAGGAHGREYTEQRHMGL